VRKTCVMCVLMMTLLLSACGGAGGEKGSEGLALTVRGEYLSAAGCVAQVKLVADYGQRVYTYKADVTLTDGQSVLTLTAPEEVAGLTVRSSGAQTQLEYDGAVLETGPLGEDGLTPLGAVFALLESARSGFMDSCTRETMGEREVLRVLCRQPEVPAGQGRETVLWFDVQTHALVQGEILQDGYRVILCEFGKFDLT